MAEINVNKELFRNLIEEAETKKAKYNETMSNLRDIANNKLQQVWGGHGYTEFKPYFDDMANQLDQRFGESLDAYIKNMKDQLARFEEADQKTSGLF